MLASRASVTDRACQSRRPQLCRAWRHRPPSHCPRSINDNLCQ
jgi:hypothetical protein